MTVKPDELIALIGAVRPGKHEPAELAHFGDLVGSLDTTTEQATAAVREWAFGSEKFKSLATLRERLRSVVNQGRAVAQQAQASVTKADWYRHHVYRAACEAQRVPDEVAQAQPIAVLAYSYRSIAKASMSACGQIREETITQLYRDCDTLGIARSKAETLLNRIADSVGTVEVNPRIAAIRQRVVQLTKENEHANG